MAVTWKNIAYEADFAARRLENLGRNTALGSRSGGTSAVADEWTLEGTPTVAYDTVDLGYGDFSVKLTATGAGNEGQKQTWTHLKPSSKYQVFVRAKATAGDTARLLTTGATTNIDTETTSTSYVSLTGEFVTDASATDVVMKLLAKADGDIVWFCGITCVEGDIAPGNFIRRMNETIYLSAAMTDTSFDGDSFGDAQADIDLSAFGNGCPAGIKVVLVWMMCRDSGSSAHDSYASVKPGTVAFGDAALQVQVGYLANDTARSLNGWVPCDANGDIRYKTNASGGDTLELWIRIFGWVLG